MSNTLQSEPTILLVEDDRPQRMALSGFLTKRGYTVLEAGSASEAEAIAAEQSVDLLLTDLRLGGKNGIELLTTLKLEQPDIQALVVTAYGTVDDAVDAMKAGAYDFVTKPVDLKRLELLVAKAHERVALTKENRALAAMAGEHGALTNLIGQNAQIAAIKSLAAKAAAAGTSILILGESGTGKEVLARGIHRASKRHSRSFVAVNCAALPETLIESELFGHEKGAFTGAETQKKGRFELADDGTLFLDEIGELPLHLQVKLLRVLQSGTFERVGGTTEVAVDIRIVAATNKDLEQAVAAGSFREDLFYRLNVISITLPPLRERPDDIPLLVEHFINKHRDITGATVRGIATEAMADLARRPFPGNVRELENWIERALVLAEGDELTCDDFPQGEATVRKPASAAIESEGDLEQQVAALETRAIGAALERNGGNKSAAARELGLSERAIRYKINKYGL